MASADMSCLLCEFIGTFMLVYVTSVTGSDQMGVTAVAFVLMVFIYAYGEKSGAHFNPALTFVTILGGETNIFTAMLYIGMQLLGATAAGLSALWLFEIKRAVGPFYGQRIQDALMVEFIYTMMLSLVFIVTLMKKTTGLGSKESYGVAIAFVLIAGKAAGGSISGGYYNPAVSFGLECADSIGGSGSMGAFFQAWGNLSLYMAMQIAGSAAAYFLYPMLYGGADFAKYLSEFFGTFLLIVTCGLSACAGERLTVLAASAALISSVYVFSGSSGSCGAQLNPAVTLAVYGSGRDLMNGATAGFYVLSQFLGGIAAALIVWSLNKTCIAFAFPPVAPKWDSASWTLICHLVIGEMLFTFLLCTVVLAVQTSSKAPKEFYGYAVGSCLAIGGYAIKGLSQALFNPAIAIAMTMFGITTNNGQYFGYMPMYWLAEILGAGLAALVFRGTHSDETKGILV